MTLSRQNLVSGLAVALVDGEVRRVCFWHDSDESITIGNVRLLG
jgi:hypothetical protein